MDAPLAAPKRSEGGSRAAVDASSTATGRATALDDTSNQVPSVTPENICENL
jgi:hypothetical protein